MRISDWSSDVCSSDLSRHSRKAHRRTTPNHVPNSLPIHLSSIPRASLTAGGGPVKTRPARAIGSTSKSYRIILMTYMSRGRARHTAPTRQPRPANPGKTMSIDVQKSGGIARVTLDRPPVNALTLQLYGEIAELFESVADWRDVNCIILSGAGRRAFCAGLDLPEFLAAPVEADPSRAAVLRRPFPPVPHPPVPVNPRG